MILIDTNVLVALVDERDGLRNRALADLGKLKGPFEVTVRDPALFRKPDRGATL